MQHGALARQGAAAHGSLAAASLLERDACVLACVLAHVPRGDDAALRLASRHLAAGVDVARHVGAGFARDLVLHVAVARLRPLLETLLACAQPHRVWRTQLSVHVEGAHALRELAALLELVAAALRREAAASAHARPCLALVCGLGTLAVHVTLDGDGTAACGEAALAAPLRQRAEEARVAYAFAEAALAGALHAHGLAYGEHFCVATVAAASAYGSVAAAAAAAAAASREPLLAHGQRLATLPAAASPPQPPPPPLAEPPFAAKRHAADEKELADEHGRDAAKLLEATAARPLAQRRKRARHASPPAPSFGATRVTGMQVAAHNVNVANFTGFFNLSDATPACLAAP